MNQTNIKEIIPFLTNDISSFEKQKPYSEWEFLEEFNNKKNLLVTIGDSWTWGDSLSDDLRKKRTKYLEKILEKTCHDRDIRKKSVYGYYLGQLLDADWINCAMPGFSNRYIAERFKQIIKNKLFLEKYDNVYFVLCLTETGREIEEWENFKWFSDCATLDQLLIKSEKYIIDYIYSIYENFNLKNLIICRNFTKSFQETQYHTKNLSTWLEINLSQNEKSLDSFDLDFSGPGTINGWRFLELSFFQNQLKHFEKDFQKYTEDFEKIKHFLEMSPMHNKVGNRHPTWESHKVWATYLFNHFSNQKT